VLAHPAGPEARASRRTSPHRVAPRATRVPRARPRCAPACDRTMATAARCSGPPVLVHAPLRRPVPAATLPPRPSDDRPPASSSAARASSTRCSWTRTSSLRANAASNSSSVTDGVAPGSNGTSSTLAPSSLQTDPLRERPPCRARLHDRRVARELGLDECESRDLRLRRARRPGRDLRVECLGKRPRELRDAFTREHRLVRGERRDVRLLHLMHRGDARARDIEDRGAQRRVRDIPSRRDPQQVQQIERECRFELRIATADREQRGRSEFGLAREHCQRPLGLRDSRACQRRANSGRVGERARHARVDRQRTRRRFRCRRERDGLLRQRARGLDAAGRPLANTCRQREHGEPTRDGDSYAPHPTTSARGVTGRPKRK
jgi:hypothetical protein